MTDYAPPSPALHGLFLLAFAKDSGDIEAIKAFAAKQRWKGVVILQGDIRTAIQHLKNHPSPNWLLVEISPEEDARPLLDALAEVCDRNTKVSALGSVNEYSFYRWLKSIGISSYALKPLTQAVLEEAWQAANQSPEQPSAEKRNCRVIAVAGARGGVGTSTLAMNLAAVIAESSDKEVAVVDLDPQTGSLAMMLDTEPSRGFRDALEKPERIDPIFFERMMSRPLKRLAVLSSEESLRDIVIHNQAATAVITTLKKDFDVIVLDCAHHLRRFTRQCMSYAQHVILATEMTALSLRDTVRLHDFLGETYPAASFIIAANRAGLASAQEISIKDFEQVLKEKIICSIPFAPELFMAQSKHIPVIRYKKHRAIAPFYRLARHLLPEISDHGAKRLLKPFFPLALQRH